MNPEQLSDAMNELPQELLEETQAARSRRRPRWKPLAAAAACLLLAAGAWALAGRPAEPAPDPEPGDLPVLTIDRDYSGMGDYPLSAEEFAAYDGGPWQEGMELAALPVFRNITRMDVANGFRTGGGDYAQLRRTMERLAAAAGADVAQAAVEVRVPDETVQAAMEDAWAGETWQCGVTFAVRGGPTELALTWKDVTVTVGESGELWVKLSRPELAALTPGAAAAWLLEQYGAVFGEQTRYFMAARDSGGCSLYFYRPEEDLTQGILQRSILKTWVRLSGGSCELRLYRPELSDANTVGDYPLVTADQARQRLAAGQHLSAWEPFPGEDRVKRVDLQYLARQTDRYFMPYYVFWVECDDGEQGVCYRPYYVPAVADAYLSDQSPSPTGAA